MGQREAKDVELLTYMYKKYISCTKIPRLHVEGRETRVLCKYFLKADRPRFSALESYLMPPVVANYERSLLWNYEQLLLLTKFYEMQHRYLSRINT